MGKQKKDTSSETSTSSKRSKTSDSKEEKTSPKRGWDSWSVDEKDKFFSALKIHGRDFDNITEKVETKNYEQVRHFYYRLVKKITKIIQPDAIDKKDQKGLLTVLNCYWIYKKRYGPRSDEQKIASSLREVVTKIRNGEQVELPSSDIEFSESDESQHALPVASHKATTLPAHPESILSTNEVLTESESEEQAKVNVQLTPRTKVIHELIEKNNLNPRLQFTLKTKKTLATIFGYLEQKWKNITSDEIRIYPVNSQHHGGWAPTNSDMKISTIYHQLGLHINEPLRLHYSFEVLLSMESQDEFDPVPDIPLVLDEPFLNPPVATTTANSNVFTTPKKSTEVLIYPGGSARPSPASTPRPSPAPSPLRDNSLSMSLYEDASTDGFNGEDQNDEIACKKRYSYYEPQHESILYEQTEDSNLPGTSKKDTTPTPKKFTFQGFF